MRSLGDSKFWALIVDDYFDYMLGRIFQKKSDLRKNITPVLKKLFVKEMLVKYIRCDNVGENRVLKRECVNAGLDITFQCTVT